MSRLRNIISRSIGRLPANLAVRLDRSALCTFTFDDCPRSALDNGGRLLEQRGLGGTFFVTGSWLDDCTARHSHMLCAEDLQALVKRGHELGCHTYSHVSLLGSSVAELHKDLDRNLEVLQRASGAEALVSFSYPFGETSWPAKAVIANRFAAARGVHPGINGRVLDLAQLRAVPIYSSDFSEQHIQALVRQAGKNRGWLIFYTHGVAEIPPQWGCTERQFSRVLDMVVASGLEVLPMRSAVGRIMHRAA